VLFPAAMILFSVAGMCALDRGGELAPAFSLPIEAGDGAIEGDRISLEGLRGRVVLLDFWASWCGPCRMSVPILSRIHERYEARGVSVLGINTEPELSVDQLREAHRRFGARFPTVCDRDGALSEGFDVSELPTLVLIDRAGRIHRIETGVPEEEALATEIETLLQ
jgi:thiol-disulfide isomerase/thioredoxin